MDQVTKLVLAILGVLATLAFIAVIVIVPVPQEVHDIMMVATGAMFSNYNSIFQYFFGSSSGSSAKDSTISKLATGKKEDTP